MNYFGVSRFAANLGPNITDHILITPPSGQLIRVVGAEIVGATADTPVTFGTKGSGASTPISPVTTVGVEDGFRLPFAAQGWFDTKVGESLVVTIGAGSAVDIDLLYTSYSIATTTTSTTTTSTSTTSTTSTSTTSTSTSSTTSTTRTSTSTTTTPSTTTSTTTSTSTSTSTTTAGGIQVFNALQAGIGGGYTNLGLLGSYYTSTDLSGSPVFTRTDTRIEFAPNANSWGGSSVSALASYPATNFSVQWQGQLLPRFSEQYTFYMTVANAGKLLIRPSGGGGYTTVINQTTSGSATGTYTPTGGSLYDFQLQYFNTGATPSFTVKWSSFSTPQEVIEIVNPVGANINPAITYDEQFQFADIVKNSRPYWCVITDPSGFYATPCTADAQGWPTEDGKLGLTEGATGLSGSFAGVWSVSCIGQASLALDWFAGPNPWVITPSATGTYNSGTNKTTWTLTNTPQVANTGTATAGSQTTITLAAGASGADSAYLDYQLVTTGGTGAGQTVGIMGYVGATKVATVEPWFTVNPDATTTYNVLTAAGFLGLVMTNTKRLPTDSPGTGVTNVKVMRPSASNSSVPYTEDVIYDDRYLLSLSKYSLFRCMAGTNNNLSSTWNAGNLATDRTLPSYFTQFGPDLGQAGAEGNNCSYEYRIMMANQMGRDLYLNIPVSATIGTGPTDPTSYIYQLATLIKNGNTVNSVNYPALLPHLKVYVEFSNELWNDNFGQTPTNRNAAIAAVTGATPEGAILNFDGIYDGTAGTQVVMERRRVGLRTQQISAIFRQVFGDAEFARVVRITLFGQGPDLNNTLDYPLKLLDVYFANSHGTSPVAVPHPVNYYLWGAGGACYYDSTTASASTPAGILAGDITPLGGGSWIPYLQGTMWWPARFGLRSMAYEGGWGLGGDTGETAIMRTAKYDNELTRTGWEDPALASYFQAGGAFPVRGTYTQIRNYSRTVTTYPLIEAAADTTSLLPPLTTNGVSIPGTLNSGNTTIVEDLFNSANRQWWGWSVIVSIFATFTLHISTSTNTTVVLLVDNVQVWTGGVLGGSVQVKLTRGLHSIAVRTPGATVQTISVTVT